jgi:uncharacterized protein (TIGR02996 family)
VASPEDLDLRLVYADQLLEQGDPRGEFIRLQLAIARTPDERWEELRTLEELKKAVSAQHLERFLVEDLGGVPEGIWDYARGFLAFADIAKDPPELLLRTPLVADVTLRGDQGDVLARIVAAGHLRQLHTLSIDNLDEAGAASLLRELVLPEELFLWDCTPSAFRLIAGSPRSEHLTTLTISGAVDDAGGVSCDRLANLPRLRSLTLPTMIGGTSLGRVLRASHLTSLHVGTFDAAALAASPSLPLLENLSVSGLIPIDVLAGARSLRTLAVPGNYSADELRRLAGFGLPLRRLWLPGHELGPASLDVLVGMRLEGLTVNRNPLAGGLKCLAQPAAASLRVLELERCGLTDADLSDFAASPYLSGLLDLELAQNHFTPAGWRALIASPHLRPRKLVLRHPRDEAVVAEARQRFGSSLQVV